MKIQFKPSKNNDESEKEFLDKCQAAIKQRRRDWLKSEEGKRIAAESRKQIDSIRGKLNDAMGELSNLDFTNLETVIDWIMKINEPLTHYYPHKPFASILDIFKDHGFEPSVKTNDYPEDEEASALWIIGWWLDRVRGGDVRDMIAIEMAKEWKKYFRD